MKEIESFSIDENKTSVKEEKDDLIDRYEVNNYNLKEPLLIRNDKKKKFPILFYDLIFALLLLLSLVISIIVEYVQKKTNYKIYKDPFLKPNISHHNYTDVKFDNGLELLLIQVDENDIGEAQLYLIKGTLIQIINRVF